MLQSEHHLETAFNVDPWPGVLQMTQKHIRLWKFGPSPSGLMESRTRRSRNGVPRERGLQPADECKVSSGINHGEFVWEPLSTAPGDGDQKGFLAAQVCTLSEVFISFASDVTKIARSGDREPG